MKVILNGASGAMGQNVIKSATAREGVEIVACISPSYETNEAEGIYTGIEQFRGEADIVIDFSHHSATPLMLAYCVERNLPVVIATTGHTERELAVIEYATNEIPIFLSANMSIGVAVTCELAKKAASFFPDADIELVEAHHNRKLDVPSGTALMLANSIKQVRDDAEFVIGRHENGKRTKQEIGIHSIRMGNVVGMHEVMITTGKETITIKHEASDRALFADGALVAGEFLLGKPAGMYNMKDLMG